MFIWQLLFCPMPRSVNSYFSDEKKLQADWLKKQFSTLFRHRFDLICWSLVFPF